MRNAGKPNVQARTLDDSELAVRSSRSPRLLPGHEGPAMNLLLGLILGVLLTIGTAFVADAFSASEVTTDTCSKQIVNWDIAKERLHETTASIETGWNRVRSSFRSL